METKKPFPFVSIVIPSYNSGRTIEDCLTSIQEQDYPCNKYEVIVVDDGSRDGSGVKALKYPVILVSQEHQGPAAARNRGLKYCKGEIVIFLDSDCTVECNWIKLHIKAHFNKKHQHMKIGYIGGPIKPSRNNRNFIETCDYYSSWYAPPRCINNIEYEYLPSTNLSIRKSVINVIGGFDEHLRCGEDIAFGSKIRKAGYAIKFSNHINCYHTGRNTFKNYLIHHYQWGLYAPIFRKYGSGLRYHYLFPPSVLYAARLFPVIAIGYTVLLSLKKRETYKLLVKLAQKYSYLSIKIITVVSNKNIDHLEKINNFVRNEMKDACFHSNIFLRGNPPEKRIYLPDISELQKKKSF